MDNSIIFLRKLDSWKKNFNCCCKKHLYEIEIDFSNISREFVLETGGNWMQYLGSNLINSPGSLG